MADPCPQSSEADARARFTLGPEKGCAQTGSLLKHADKSRKIVANAAPVSQTNEMARREAGTRALDHFLAGGRRQLEPAVLQPAAPFLDTAGEEIRARLYLTTDGSGEELCLRPEYTIPVCLAHLATRKGDAEAEYAYLGPVFRTRPDFGGEMIQTGLESYGRRDIEAADAEILALALEAAERAGSGPLDVRIGDARVFDGVLAGLGLPGIWLRRVRRGLAQGRSLEAIVNGGGQGAMTQPGVLAALESTDHAGAKALVEDLLEIAGIASVGGRSVGEIADRFLEQAAARSDSGVNPEKQAILRRFLAISGDLDATLAQLRALAREARLDLTEALDSFEQRIGFLAARGLRIQQFVYSAAFVRDLDYYTGFVFEAADPGSPGSAPVIGGGRYDGLARKLGAANDLPAIGAAIWVDRLPISGARS
jgi:ATP phosphoribosyltransferase regulatory subunit